ncbi:T9SS type A sorting domain-containing protein [Chitinophaga qingshengii]|uniref:PKD domain-containing protein n=1 Tax=Chitinophaga qingshengii TaxID=1569794 RepID=A0ABR7TLE8_9BACT|nr:T9SS type A sorting domain-containing protein [Chitinophaga qingshengii]MBC9930239.1 PKD domain-containing protein [Chitinophaga qingshengii]
MTWSRLMDCTENKATFRFNVPYPYSDVDACTVNLDDGQGQLPYSTDWVYNTRYRSGGDKKIRLWIRKKDGHIDSLTTVINIVDTRILIFGYPPRVKQVIYPFPFIECPVVLEQTEIDHRWIFEGKTYDTRCLEIKAPGMYVLESTSPNCDRRYLDTLYVTTKGYVKTDFNLTDSALVNCGIALLNNRSHGANGIAGVKWVFESGATSSALTPPPLNLHWGANPVKLIVTDSIGQVDSLTKVILREPFDSNRVRLPQDSAIQPGDTLRLRYSQRFYWGPGQMPPAKIEWSTGAATEDIQITEPGKYWVKVTPCLQNPSQAYTDTMVLDKFRLSFEYDGGSLNCSFYPKLNYYYPGSYSWNFGDNSTSYVKNAKHTYQRAGTYLVTAYFVDVKGRKDSAQRSITVAPLSLKADFSFDNTQNPTLRFTGNATTAPGRKVLYDWNFGDGTNNVTADVVNHTYAASGVYTVELIAMDSITQQMDTVRRRITVWPALHIEGDTIYKGIPVNLKINAPFYGDTSVHCTWYPDYITGHQATFNRTDTYWATVTAPGGFKRTDTIRVVPTTFGDSFTTKRDTDGQLTMIFNAPASTQYPGTAYWNFGDTTRIDSGLLTKHTYGKPGYYHVKMWRGSTPVDTAYQRIYIAPPIKVNLGPDKVMPDTLVIGIWAGQILDSFYRANLPDVSLTWSDGSTRDYILITSPGIYTLTARAYGFVSTDTIAILPPVVRVSMNYDARSGDASKIYFENTSVILNPATITWSFGDGSPDVTGNNKVAHSFSLPGTYQVTMTISTYDGYVYSTSEKVKVWPPLVLGTDTAFTGSPVQLKVNEPYFSDTTVACVWYPGGVNSKSLIVTQPGTYYVEVTAPHYVGMNSIKVTTAPSGPLAPQFNYVVSPVNKLDVTFTNTSGNMSSGQLRCKWNFGDGDTAVTNGWQALTVTHRYRQTGAYTVRMRVFDNGGRQGDTTALIVLPGAEMVPKANFSVQRANDGLYTMNFINTSVVKTGAAKASWTLGDGTSSTSWHTTHAYATPGTYQVKLLVEDSLGLKDSLLLPVLITPPITLNLGPDTVLRNAQPILLSGYNAIGGIIDQVNWRWSTGDTTHSLLVTQPGTYWLRATRYGYSVADTIIVSVPAPLPPVVDSNARIVQVKDSVPVTVSFPVARHADNVYTIQLANADNGPIPGARAMAAAAPVVTNIVSFASTDPRVAANIKLPADLPCGKQYRIRVVASSPADNSAWSAPFEVVNMPAIPQIAQRGDTLESSTAAAYQWYKNGMPVPGATSKAIRAKADGSYQVQVSAGGDCNAISAPLAMIITGLDNGGLTVSPLTVYPNPSSGAVYLQLEKQPAQPLLINVYNTSGRVVHSLLMKDKQAVLDLSHMPKGLYYVQVSGREKQKPVLISIQ